MYTNYPNFFLFEEEAYEKKFNDEKKDYKDDIDERYSILARIDKLVKNILRFIVLVILKIVDTILKIIGKMKNPEQRYNAFLRRHFVKDATTTVYRLDKFLYDKRFFEDYSKFLTFVKNKSENKEVDNTHYKDYTNDLVAFSEHFEREGVFLKLPETYSDYLKFMKETVSTIKFLEKNLEQDQKDVEELKNKNSSENFISSLLERIKFQKKSIFILTKFLKHYEKIATEINDFSYKEDEKKESEKK
jgi:hypothetical protein